MKKSLQVQINTPCHENWQNMKPAEQGRFCGSCQKTVVDFTNMTDEELLIWVTRSGKDTCGRFNNDQLQRDIIIYPEKKFSFRYLWQFMVASLLIAGKGEAQTGKPVFIKTEIKKPSTSNDKYLMGDTVMTLTKKFIISGTITDSSNNTPITQASIIMKGTTNGCVSDSVGKFAFEYEDDIQQIELEFSSVGYESKTLIIPRNESINPIDISLTLSASMLGEVSVIGYETIRCRSLTGLVGYVTVDHERSIFDTLFSFKRDIVIYPNPVARGSSINFVMNLKQTDQYQLELVDASGKLLLSKLISVGSVKQQESIPTNPSWSKGVYYLRISQPGKKFNKTTKVVLQ